jgi:ABC-type multidrug transport system fused ATPase/permease subunit
VLILATIQGFVSLLDVIGVAFTGLVGVISVNALQGGLPSNAVVKALDFLNLEKLTLSNQLQILSGITIAVLLGKTLASIYFAKLTTRLLCELSANASANILRKFFNLPYGEVRKLTQQEAIFATTRGVNTVIVGVIGSAIGLGIDAILVIALSLALIFISPLSGLVFILLFLAIWQTLRLKLHDVNAKLSMEETEISIQTSNLISNTLDSFKELFVLNRLDMIVDDLEEQRHKLARVAAVTSFNPQYAKYVFEFGIVAISFAITAIQLWQYDASRAIGTITLFIAAGARISPALLRMQQNYLMLSSSAGVSAPTLELSRKLQSQTNSIRRENIFEASSRFTPKVEISNLRFGYDRENLIIKDLNLLVEAGEFLAIVGPSGAGKSTLIDLCLGLQEPTSGLILISGIEPSLAIQKWPGKIAYVPQRVHLANNTLRENLVFGNKEQKNVDRRCMEVLEEVGLTDEFARMQMTLDTYIGSDQNALSGGQVQRIGIARALLNSPELLVLDEATSSLDAETENQISTMIGNLPKKITRVVIAHRLSTIQAADRVLYLSPDSPPQVGSFQSLRTNIPDFDNQAKLMGL